jgi:hypothetical protein
MPALSSSANGEQRPGAELAGGSGSACPTGFVQVGQALPPANRVYDLPAKLNARKSGFFSSSA